MYETYFDKVQPYFGQGKIQSHFMDTNSFVLTMKTEKIIEDLKNLEAIFDFSNLDEKLEPSINKNLKNNTIQ